MGIVLVKLQEPESELIGLFEYGLLIQELQIQQRHQEGLIGPDNGPVIEHQTQADIGYFDADGPDHLVLDDIFDFLLLPDLEHPLVIQQFDLHLDIELVFLRHQELHFFGLADFVSVYL